jgi:hypothetical protein
LALKLHPDFKRRIQYILVPFFCNLLNERCILKSTVSNVFVLLGHFSGRFGHVRIVHYVHWQWVMKTADCVGERGEVKKLTKPENTLLNQRYEKFFVVWRIFMYNLKTAVWSKLYKKVVFKTPLEVWRRDIKVVKVVYKQYNRWRQL